MSTAGKWNSRGFTLIELCVVILLMGTMLFIAAPRIHDSIFEDSLHSAMKYIMGKSRELRADAVRDNVDYVMHFDIDKNLLWYETSDMSAEKRDEMKRKSFRLPESVKILEVSIIGGSRRSEGDATVRFFRRGYTQPAMLYLSQNERIFTLVLNPFSGMAKTYDKLIKFDENRTEFNVSGTSHPIDISSQQPA